MNCDAQNGWLDREGLGAGVLLYVFVILSVVDDCILRKRVVDDFIGHVISDVKRVLV